MSRLFPPIDNGLTELDAPVTRVTVMEDRAQIRREGRIELSAGRQRLVVHGVSPVLQDVSLIASLTDGDGRIADVKARRAWRISADDRPEHAASLEAAIDEKSRHWQHVEEEREQARQRLDRLRTMIEQATREIPVDAAWGRVDPGTWKTTFETLFSRARQAVEADLTGFHEQQDVRDDLSNLLKQRQAIDTLDTRFVGWLGIDVDLERPQPVQIAIDYIVPCALWRPVHRVRWASGASVDVVTSALLWQNTGESWTDVELHFSTSRASLGHEPPKLTDDPLEAQRKDEELRVEVRRVEIQKAAVDEGEEIEAGGGGTTEVPTPVALAAVDDGGQRRHLQAPGRHRVESDGRPVRIPLSRFEGEGHGELITMPEEESVAVWRVAAENRSAEPMLAGPVELVRDYGPVGWTETRFVAPHSRFELGFGPDESVRVERTVKRSRVPRRSDEWPAIRRTVRIYLSNLDDVSKRVKVIERIPVSEVDEVRITLDADATSAGHDVDDDGFVTWTVTLAGRQNIELQLQWTLESAPGLSFDLD